MNKEHIEEDEVDLQEILKTLLKNKWYIFWFTCVGVFLSIIIALTLSPTYQATISFLSPDKASVLFVNKTKITNEISKTMYKLFLDKYKSRKYQEEVFLSHGYLNKFYPENEQTTKSNDFFSNAMKSFKKVTVKIKKNGEDDISEQPITFSLEGHNPKVISNFLNDLAKKANTDTVKDLFNTARHKFNIRIDEISKQKPLLLAKVKIDRLAQIERIKIEDQEKTNEISGSIKRLQTKEKYNRSNEIKRIEDSNTQKILEAQNLIQRLRIKAKKDRLNRITFLEDNLKMAHELEIKDNNFGYTGGNKENSTLVEINAKKSQPKWYLYGEKALLEEINLLKNRESDDAYIPEITKLQNSIMAIQSDQKLKALKNRVNDDPYIPEIANLQSKLKQINSNTKLKALENRLNDSPFIANEINKLEVEEIKLKGLVFDNKGVNAMQFSQRGYAPDIPIKPNKKLIVIIGFMLSLMLAIFSVFIRNMLNHNKSSTSNNLVNPEYKNFKLKEGKHEP